MYNFAPGRAVSGFPFLFNKFSLPYPNQLANSNLPILAYKKMLLSYMSFCPSLTLPPSHLSKSYEMFRQLSPLLYHLACFNYMCVPLFSSIKMDARDGIEPSIALLQRAVLPFDHLADSLCPP